MNISCHPTSKTPRHLQLEGLLPTRSLWYAWCWPKTQITAARHHFHMKTPRVTWEEIRLKWKNHVKDSRKKSSPWEIRIWSSFFSPESLSRPKKQEGPRASNGDIFRKIQRHVSSAGVFFLKHPMELHYNDTWWINSYTNWSSFSVGIFEPVLETAWTMYLRCDWHPPKT